MSKAARKSDSIEEVGNDSLFPECLFPDDKPFNERESEVRGYADSETREEHYKKFREDEKIRFKNQLSDVAIELNDKQMELKELVKEQKEVMKPLISLKKELLENLKTGSVWTDEILFRIVDEKSKLIGVYDRHGFLQRIEKLKRGRGLQTTIKPLNQASDMDDIPQFDE